MGNEPRDAKKGRLELDDPLAPPVSRPTVRPSFDPEQYAEDSEIRERMPTLTDDAVLEQARLQSMPSVAPPAKRQTTMPGPLTGGNPRDSAVEIDTGEADIDLLDDSEQTAILAARLSPLTRVPALVGEMTKLGTLLEDPKTAYVLGFVDGILPLETIIEVTGLPELETLRVLDHMISQGVVVFKPRPAPQS